MARMDLEQTGGSEDITPESPAQDPSWSTFSQHDYLLPSTVPSQSTYHFPIGICHLGKPMKTRKGQLFVCCVHARGFCLVSPSHQVWEIWVYQFVSSRCGGKWVQVWEETSVLEDLWEDLPASQRLFGRLHASQSGQEKKKLWSKRVHAPVVGLHWVTRSVNTQKLVIKTCSGKAARRRTQWKSIARSRLTTRC